MKKLGSFIAGATLLVIAGSGCQQAIPMSDATMMAKADSIYASRKMALMDSMAKDCEMNSAAWIQIKADSIYKADSAAMAMMK